VSLRCFVLPLPLVPHSFAVLLAQDGTLTIWDIVNGLAVQTFTLATSHGITAAAWCPSQIGQPVEAFVVGEGVGKVTIYRKAAVSPRHPANFLICPWFSAEKL
jgi:hypothetical protein